MKLHHLNRTSHHDESFRVSHNDKPHFLKIWHFHEELELVYIVKSSGVQFIGDSIERFEPGDVVLIGKELPHMWMNDSSYFEKESKLSAEAISVHFKKDFLGNNFFDLPEMKRIGNLIKKSSLGIKFKSSSLGTKKLFESLLNLDSSLKLIKLLELLEHLTHIKDYELLVSNGYLKEANKTNSDRLDMMYEYIFQNFNKPISSKDVAKHINMNFSSFSRFFNQTHHKSFTTYLNKIRIGYACKLLLEGKESITSICYQCGFNNVSNFNRQFKKFKNESPSSYLKVRRENFS